MRRCGDSFRLERRWQADSRFSASSGPWLPHHFGETSMWPNVYVMLMESRRVWGCCLNVRMCYPVDRFRVSRQPEWIPAALIEYRLIEGGTWSYDLRNEETSMIRCKKDRGSKLTGGRLPGRLVSSSVYGRFLPFAKLMAESTLFHHFLLFKPHPLVSEFSHFIGRFTQSSIQISITVR